MKIRLVESRDGSNKREFPVVYEDIITREYWIAFRRSPSIFCYDLKPTKGKNNSITMTEEEFENYITKGKCDIPESELRIIVNFTKY